MNTDFDSTLGRFMKLAGTGSYTDVASVLGMSPNALSNRKNAGSIPYKEIVVAAIGMGIDLNEIFYQPESGPIQSTENGEKIDPKQALLVVLDVINELGIADTLSSEQVQALLGYTFTHKASKRRLIEFIQAAFKLNGIELSGK